MFKDIRNYILENEFKVTVLKNKVDIVNYEEIDHFDDNKVMVRHKNGLIKVKGKDLTISKLLNDEILIVGKLEEIDFA